MNFQVRWRSIAKGVATLIPVASRFANQAAGSPVSSRYFYSVWLRHLVSLVSARPGFSYGVVAELGPGDALGLGLCALLSGAKRYIGLDRVAFGLRADNVTMLDELVTLFRARAPIPDDSEMPAVFPKLRSYDFPRAILTDAVLRESLDALRLARIRDDLHRVETFVDDNLLCYAAPWDVSDHVRAASVDLLISQAVLEHVDDIEGAYAAMHRWLKRDGTMSHRIDYTSHGITRDWYGHWTISSTSWRLVRGRRAYLINRLPHSAHLRALRRNGFEILDCSESFAQTPAPAESMRIAHEASDLPISGAYLVARPVDR